MQPFSIQRFKLMWRQRESKGRGLATENGGGKRFTFEKKKRKRARKIADREGESALACVIKFTRADLNLCPEINSNFRNDDDHSQRHKANLDNCIMPPAKHHHHHHSSFRARRPSSNSSLGLCEIFPMREFH